VNNQVNRGKAIEITATAAISSGQPVLVGSLVGIASSKYAVGDTAVIWLYGAFLVNKAAEAWTPGAKVYWDNTNNVFTVTAGANTFAGYASNAQLIGDTQGIVILRQ
jgi:predicted RecA/RadA family phage recombinase